MVSLTGQEEDMLEGEEGEAAQYAMEILVKLAEAHDADRLVKADSAHVAAGLYPEEMEWYSKLQEGNKKFRCFTSLHPWGMDDEHWEEVGTVRGNDDLIKEFLEELLDMRIDMGGIPMGTCIQYLLGDYLRPGDHFSWTGSSGVVFANSVLGAMGNVDGIVTNYSVAITGRVPEYGMHLKENRKGEISVETDFDFEELGDGEIGAFSYHVGEIAGNRIPVFEDLPEDLRLGELKALASPLHVSGSVPMFHAVGTTPEAETREEAFQGDEPKEEITVEKEDIDRVLEEFQIDGEIDLVITGCPHCTYEELSKIADALDGEDLEKEFWIGTSHQVKAVADRAGWTDKIEEAGGKVLTNLCLGPGNPCAACGFENILTNSPRMAYYAPDVNSDLRNLDECIEIAIEGGS